MSPQRSTLRLFLSSNTQDFIEVGGIGHAYGNRNGFLSSNTQDFIEVQSTMILGITPIPFLSSNTQDFIEVVPEVPTEAIHPYS